jgi:hypothetical protein
MLVLSTNQAMGKPKSKAKKVAVAVNISVFPATR